MLFQVLIRKPFSAASLIILFISEFTGTTKFLATTV